MSERKIRNLIARQNAEEKAAVWSRIEAELGEENAVEKPKHRRSPKFWKILSACTSVAVVLIVGLGLGLGLGLNKTPDVSQVEPPPNAEFRYFSAADCELKESEYTLKQYAEVYKVELLYLDWYEETEDYSNYLYKLKDSGDAVCLEERFMCPDSNYVYTYVTDDHTEMDFITWRNEDTGEKVVINGVTAYYQEGQGNKINFEYKGYRYYIKLDIEDFDYLCQIAQSMLSNG